MFSGSRDREFQFTFRELGVAVNKKKVLDNIDGQVTQGELLVVSGPTGEYYSTDLSKVRNGIEARLPSGHQKVASFVQIEILCTDIIFKV